jgi:hypothetical protein
MPRTKTTKKKPEKRLHGVTTPVSLESMTTRSSGLENSSTSPLAAVARSVSHALGFGATSDAPGNEVGKGEESNNESSNDDDYPFNIYYDGNSGVFEFESSRLPSDIDYSFWNETLWCLFDAKFKEEANLAGMCVGLSTIILSTSPQQDMVNDFKKSPVPQIFYMPIWTEAELEVIAPLFPFFHISADAWRERFEILGGIPRHVLEDTMVSPTAILESAC